MAMLLRSCCCYFPPVCFLHVCFFSIALSLPSRLTLLAVMLAGTLPFSRVGDEVHKNNNTVEFLADRIKSGAVSWEFLPEVTPDCRALLEKLITADPHSRLSTHQVLQHKWFDSIRDEVSTVFGDPLLKTVVSSSSA